MSKQQQLLIAIVLKSKEDFVSPVSIIPQYSSYEAVTITTKALEEVHFIKFQTITIDRERALNEIILGTGIGVVVSGIFLHLEL